MNLTAKLGCYVGCYVGCYAVVMVVIFFKSISYKLKNSYNNLITTIFSNGCYDFLNINKYLTPT